MSVKISRPSEGNTGRTVEFDAVTQEMEAPENGASAPDSSILGQLRQRAQDQQKTKQRDFAVGGDFGDWMLLRYHPLRPEEVDRFINRRVNDDDVQALEMNMDLIARACVAVVGNNPETGEQEILKNAEGQPLRITHELAEFLELPIPPGAELTSREVVIILFGNNGMAIGNHGDAVVTWMQNPQEDEVGEV